MKFIKFSSTICLVFLLLFSTNQVAYGATVVLSNFDLVDSGKHLDWSGSTKYQTLFNNAVNTWEAYKPGIIRKDTALTIEDAVISDYYEVSNMAGVTYSGGSIKFNTYVLDTVSVFMQQNVMTHELGHALRLDHNTSDDIMYAKATNRTSLSNNDKASYDHAYYYY